MTVLVQCPPDHWRAAPWSSTAAQKLAVGQDTPLGAGPRVPVEGFEAGSIGTGAENVWPFHWSAYPVSSTAVQKLAEGQDTPVKEEVVPKGSGLVQRTPSQRAIPPEAAIQKVALTQEIDEAEPQAPIVPCHCPS